MIWKTFFRVFAERSPTPYFYNEISPSRGPSFHNFDSKMAKLHFWPKRGQWDPMWSEFDSIWIKFDPNWVKLGPNEAQSIFTNSRSTAQADVMLFVSYVWEKGQFIAFPYHATYNLSILSTQHRNARFWNADHRIQNAAPKRKF